VAAVRIASKKRESGRVPRQARHTQRQRGKADGWRRAGSGGRDEQRGGSRVPSSVEPTAAAAAPRAMGITPSGTGHALAALRLPETKQVFA